MGQKCGKSGVHGLLDVVLLDGGRAKNEERLPSGRWLTSHLVTVSARVKVRVLRLSAEVRIAALLPGTY